jgi:hypothetical protein
MNNVIGCDKLDCIYSHICPKNKGYIKENEFFCDEYRNLEMFLNEIVMKNMNK